MKSVTKFINNKMVVKKIIKKKVKKVVVTQKNVGKVVRATKKALKKKTVKKTTPKKQNKSVKQTKSEKEENHNNKPYKYAEYLIFIDWMATPRVVREIETQTDFAEKYGIDKDTIVAWKKKADFWNAVIQQRKLSATEKTGDVIKKLEIVALSGDVSAIRLYMQYTGELVEKKQEDLGASPELIEALERMRRVLPD